MRHDSLGFFWQDLPPEPKVKKEKIKRTPPPRVWEEPDYLPHLEEARAARFSVMNTEELAAMEWSNDFFIFDLECYQNLFFIAFVSYQTGKYVFVQTTDEDSCNDTQRDLIRYIFETCKIVGFNSKHYDAPMVSLFVAGWPCDELKRASDAIILYGEQGRDICKQNKVKMLTANHIDIKEVAPLSASLKTYSGRIHTPRMQDLPFHPDTLLSDDQKTIVRWYCTNDLTNTAFLRKALNEQIKLREVMTEEYQIDLRSKSDAQIAEAVIVREVTKIQGSRLERPEPLMPGTLLRYNVPSGMEFKNPNTQWALQFVTSLDFPIGLNAKVTLPQLLENLVIPIGEGKYRMGIGGLHSSEERAAHRADNEYGMCELDVTSYYPFIILNLGLCPEAMGQPFIRVYGALVKRRLDAKARGQKTVADSLKITINGTFGKLNSPYSFLYSPQSMFQVTMSGQLYLMMLIEALEHAGITVVSANTDGIVLRYKRNMNAVLGYVVSEWEAVTGFNIERNELLGLFSRDVNNYIAVKEPKLGKPPTVKTKGVFAFAGLSKNPANEIMIIAIEELLTKGIPYQQTIYECNDIRKFVTVRNVRGGAVKVSENGQVEYLGKAIRWYYAKDEKNPIIYAESGNFVPRSASAKPLMQLPTQLPADLDHDWYVEETRKMLVGIGYLEPDTSVTT